MASSIAVFLSHFGKGKFWPLSTGRKVLCVPVHTRSEGFFAEGATCSNTTFSYYFSLNRRQWIAARSCSRSIGGGQCASVEATSPSSSGPRNISLPQSMASWQSDMSCPCQLEGF